MAKRGFFAELNYQGQQAEKRRRQEQAALHRAQVAAQREAERSRKAFERAQATAQRAAAAQQKAAEKEAARLHAESRLAEAAALNADLASQLEQIDELLAWSLEVDDHVDLESLRVTAEHPPFEPGMLRFAASPMPELVYPPEPVYEEPAAPSGLGAAFGGKKRHQEATERARAEYDLARRQWHERATAQHARYVAEQTLRDKSEKDRLRRLAAAEKSYRDECRRREEEAEAHNTKLQTFINELAFDVESAIHEYVGIVLSNSVYPEVFPVSHDHQFSLDARELTLTATVPEPSTIPAVKEYRYVKVKDEITTTALPVRAQKDRYASAVWQVAVRTLHEIFEADRAGKITSISLTVGMDRIAPATGRPETVPLVVVAADRNTFRGFDLANVVPQATLTHLGPRCRSHRSTSPRPTPAGVSGSGVSGEVQSTAWLARTAAGVGTASGLAAGPVMAGTTQGVAALARG